MSTETVMLIARLGILCAKVAAILFLLTIVAAVVGKLSRKWRGRFAKYHPKVGWTIVILFVIHAICLAFAGTYFGKKIPFTGVLTLVVLFLVAISGVILKNKIMDSRVSLGAKKQYRIFHTFCVTILFVAVLLHLYAFKNPNIIPSMQQSEPSVEAQN